MRRSCRQRSGVCRSWCGCRLAIRGGSLEDLILARGARRVGLPGWGIFERSWALSTSVPRRDRKAAAELLDRVEAVAESTDAEWCVGLLECSGAEIERLGSAVVGMTKVVAAVESVECRNSGGGSVKAAGGIEAVQAAVLELLECLDRCGNAVLRSLAVLSAGAGVKVKVLLYCIQHRTVK